MNISTAEAGDIPQLSELLNLLFTQEADFTPNPEKQYAALRRIIAAPEIGRILVWRELPAILGMVNVLFSISTAEGGKVAFLEDMIVHPAHRDRSIGGRLLAAAVDLCTTEGCSRITLLTDRDNDAAIRFYRRQGFELSGMVPLRLYPAKS
ncbi:MAG: GNAT family N-acetyltransferase [Gammaproteobacteria bacterium]